MQIPSVSSHFKISMIVIWSIALVAGTWFECTKYYGPQEVQQVSHVQKTLVPGTVLAAKEAAPIKPATVVPNGSKAIATIHIVVPESKPVASSKAAVMPPECAAYVSQLTCPATTLDATEVKDKSGQVDLVVKNADGSNANVVFNAGLTQDTYKFHHWSLGAAMPLGLSGTSKYGLAGAYEFQRLPVTVGAAIFTVNGKPAEVITAMIKL